MIYILYHVVGGIEYDRFDLLGRLGLCGDERGYFRARGTRVANILRLTHRNMAFERFVLIVIPTDDAATDGTVNSGDDWLP